MGKILRKSYENYEAYFPKLCVFVGQKSIFRHYYTENVKDRIYSRVYKVNNESAALLSQFISVKVKKNVRKSQVRFREKLRKLRLSQNDAFLMIKKTCN